MINKKIMEKAGFNKEVETVEQGRCPFCKNKIKMEEFRDSISWREFHISGLCQKCQDDFFDDGGEDDADT